MPLSLLLLACAVRSDVPPDPLPPPPRRGVTLSISRTLPAPPAEVWPHLTEPALLSAWSRTRIEAHRPVAGDPSAPGAVRAVTVQALGARHLYEVVEHHEPERLFRYRVFAGGGLRYHHGEIRLSEADTAGASQLQWEIRLTPRVPGIGPLLRWHLARQFADDLDSLEQQLSDSL